MEKHYALEAGCAVLGRTLWNNLVIGNKTSTLDTYEGFQRIGLPKDIFPEDYPIKFDCSFSYRDMATITVLNPFRVAMLNKNRVKIQAETEEELRVTESKLKEICESKGVTICDADAPLEKPYIPTQPNSQAS